MSDAVNIIQQELDNIDEKLTLHAYHKAVLENLLKKMDVKTGALSIPKPKRKYTRRVDVEQVKKRQDVRVKNARMVASVVQNRGLTKSQAIKNLLARGELITYKDWIHPETVILSDTSPTGIGRRLHNQLFQGTVYAK
jgi:hypothetical protein|tara:strand:- start:1 stop:414 length:414 start_codon:yes stop_codon:yes gene_type:complete